MRRAQWRRCRAVVVSRPAGAGSRLSYTGPLFARLPLPIPEPVQAFLDGSRPSACVVLSSSTPQMLRAVAQRLRDAGLRMIVGATIHDFAPYADPDMVVAGLRPSHEVMPRVDLVVCMGGQGSVQTAMASGTPLIGIPLHPEQELDVDLAVRQGVALAIAPRQADSEARRPCRHAELGAAGAAAAPALRGAAPVGRLASARGAAS